MPEYFWDMSLYDWTLFHERVELENKKELDKQVFFFETTWRQTRVLWATIKNIVGGVDGQAVQPTDLIKFKSDVEAEVEEAATKPKHSLKLMREKFGSTFKYGDN